MEMAPPNQSIRDIGDKQNRHTFPPTRQPKGLVRADGESLAKLRFHLLGAGKSLHPFFQRGTTGTFPAFSKIDQHTAPATPGIRLFRPPLYPAI